MRRIEAAARWVLIALLIVNSALVAWIVLAKPPARELKPEHLELDNLDPQSFTTKIDNPYYPLLPGSVHRLTGKTPDGMEEATITVTDKTKVVAGVTTRVVTDVTRLNGELAEKTTDYFAQDADGNVWYFGEVTADYENGKVVSRSGAFEAGVDGAEGGIAMPADPEVSDAFRIEHDPGNAMDMAWVVETGLKAHGFENVIRVLEWSPLEPEITVQKLYGRGVGLLAEDSLSGDPEHFKLEEVR